MNAQAAERVKEIVDELSGISLAELTQKSDAQAKLTELDSCLEQVRGFASMVEGLLGQIPSNGSNGHRARAPRATRTAGRRVRGRRGPGEFKATAFIYDCVKEAGKTGIRNSEIADAVAKARPGGHVRRSALVSTILKRLMLKGKVARRRDKWFVK